MDRPSSVRGFYGTGASRFRVVAVYPGAGQEKPPERKPDDPALRGGSRGGGNGDRPARDELEPAPPTPGFPMLGSTAIFCAEQHLLKTPMPSRLLKLLPHLSSLSLSL